MKVMFNRIEEWLVELDKDRELNAVKNRRARVTMQFRPTGFDSLVSVFLIAGYVSFDDLVCLDHFVGEELADGRGDGRTCEQARKIILRLREQLQERGLDVRAGIFSPDTTPLPTSRFPDAC